MGGGEVGQLKVVLPAAATFSRGGEGLLISPRNVSDVLCSGTALAFMAAAAVKSGACAGQSGVGTFLVTLRLNL
jgi:hypothetical protein